MGQLRLHAVAGAEQLSGQRRDSRRRAGPTAFGGRRGRDVIASFGGSDRISAKAGRDLRVVPPHDRRLERERAGVRQAALG
jgi:hypothetical protein